MENDINTENIAHENLVNHLKFYFKKNNTNALKISKLIGVGNQTIYKLIDKSMSPTISTISKICKIFNCSAAELLAEDLFIDLPIFDTLDDYQKNITKKEYRVYFPKSYQEMFIKNNLFVLQCSFEKNELIKLNNNMVEIELPNEYGILCFKCLGNINSIENIGRYIVSLQNHLTAIDISMIGIDAATIRVHKQKDFVTYPIKDIELLYKCIGNIILTENNKYYFKSKSI